MKCEKCGSDMWDNRPKKESGEFKSTSPDFKCKNKECMAVVWPEKSKDSTPRRTQKVASAQGDSTREDGMAFLNASRGAVEIVVAKIKIQMVSQIDGIQKPLEDKFIRDEVMKWTEFLYKLNTEKNFEVPQVKDNGIQF